MRGCVAAGAVVALGDRRHRGVVGPAQCRAGAAVVVGARLGVGARRYDRLRVVRGSRVAHRLDRADIRAAAEDRTQADVALLPRLLLLPEPLPVSVVV